MNNSFLKGRGLSFIPKKIDNLFRLNPKYPTESLDYVYLKQFLDRKKVAPILLKEVFFILRPKGYLIIDYRNTKEINFQSMERLLWWLFKGNYNIIEHTKNVKSRLIIQKSRAVFSPNDSINKWSFGIITNGERDEWIEQIISSIKRQHIPQYEIIVCGKYRKRPEENFVYINFNERSDRGWVTKKKNLIAEKAKYENLCIMHDRIVFENGWFYGMKKYGNAFEIIGCRQTLKNGMRAGDWLTYGGPFNQLYRIASLDYKDWDEWVYLSLQLIIMKKSMYEKILLDETRYWCGYEDNDFASRLKDAGYIIRFNPYSEALALSWNHGNIPAKYDLSKGLIPDMFARRLMRSVARLFYNVPIINKIMFKLYWLLSKTPLYKKIIS